MASVYIDATKGQRKMAKRLNMKDHFSDFFCTLKYNENGTYINLFPFNGKTNMSLLHQKPH